MTRPRTRARIARAAAFVVLVAVVAALAVAPEKYPWTINLTGSLPGLLYALGPIDRPIARGDTILVCAPASVAALGAQRGYLPAGPCPGQTAPLLKLVAAVGGDFVDLRARSIEVNGRCLGHSVTFDHDHLGRKLPQIARGRYRLGAGQLWLWTPAERSFDSRYFGPVRASDVTYFASPIAVEQPAVLMLANGPCQAVVPASASGTAR